MPQQLTRKEKKTIESFRKIGEDVHMGVVKIDHDKCNGCGLCTHCCAAACLELVDKKSNMQKENPFCMSCGDCVAICPEDAIELVEFIQFKKAFKYLDRGKPDWPRKF